MQQSPTIDVLTEVAIAFWGIVEECGLNKLQKLGCVSEA
jgi:hypothetical protein